jgi:hypothetical protein
MQERKAVAAFRILICLTIYLLIKQHICVLGFLEKCPAHVSRFAQY